MNLSPSDLDKPISDLYMVGPIYAKRLEKLSIHTIRDLLYHLPFRYDNFTKISDVQNLTESETSTIKVTVLDIKNQFTKFGKKLTKATVADQTGQIDVIWFNQPFLTSTIKKNSQIYLSGKVESQGYKQLLSSPDYETVKEINPINTINPPIHTARIVPVYPETYGVSSKWLRSRIVPVLNSLTAFPDFLPKEIISKEGFPTLLEALIQIHFPESFEKSEASLRRLSFEELLLIQLSSRLRKIAWKKEKVQKIIKVDQEKIISFIASLPFELTNAQKKAVKEILSDLEKDTPANRLLEGDVGSGKTVVAAIAIYAVCQNGLKSAFMVPTEILANQHYTTLKALLEPYSIKVGIVTSSKKSQEFDVVVGTHALISEQFKTKGIELVIIDEQHRFGVEQRGLIKSKGINPHLLSMTATPIPRTMALTLYGELDLSVLDEMPKGRTQIKTWVVPKEKRESAYKWIEKEVKGKPNQAFIVCPFIEESESSETAKAAKKEFEYLKTNIFPDLRLGLLHGKLKSKEKETILQQFKNGELDILVSTPVVEVGIDIPTATIMMVEGAERFGLAQLHQLRGRVGRGSEQSYCLLFTESGNENIIKRLKILETEQIGSRIAEADLKNRGEGEVFGTKQHGKANLKIASLTDREMIEKSSFWAQYLIKQSENLDKFPELKEKVEEVQRKQLIEPN